MKTTKILYRPESAHAWADGRKCRTQRIITRLNGYGKITEFGRTDTAHYKWHFRDKRMLWNDIEDIHGLCPYGGPVDRLQLLTTWAVNRGLDDLKPSGLPYELYLRCARACWTDSIWTELNGIEKPKDAGKKRPGMFMPDWLRHLMPHPKILSIEVRRLQDMTDEEALEEGIVEVRPGEWSENPDATNGQSLGSPRMAYANWINRIHGGPNWNIRDIVPIWNSNPWVWNIRHQSKSEMEEDNER